MLADEPSRLQRVQATDERLEWPGSGSHFGTSVPSTESQQGEGGFVPAPPAFLLTERLGIVFIADEIQSGFGRAGKMFGYQHAAIEPDLIAMA